MKTDLSGYDREDIVIQYLLFDLLQKKLTTSCNIQLQSNKSGETK